MMAMVVVTMVIVIVMVMICYSPLSPSAHPRAFAALATSLRRFAPFQT